MKRINKGKRGRPNINVLDNSGYTRLVCLLALGYDTINQIKAEYPKTPFKSPKTKLKKQRIPESTIITKYLYILGLIPKRNRKSTEGKRVSKPQIKLISWSDDMAKIKFHWNVFLGQIYGIILTDMNRRENQLKDYLTKIEHNQKIYKEKFDKSKLIKNRILLKRYYIESKDLIIEFKDIIQKISIFKKEARKFFLNDSKHHIWFINILQYYLKRILCVCDYTKDYPSLKQAIREFLLSETYREHGSTKLTNFHNFLIILKKYSFYYNMKIGWIINLKLKLQEYEDTIAEDYMKSQEEEAEKYYNQPMEEVMQGK